MFLFFLNCACCVFRDVLNIRFIIFVLCLSECQLVALYNVRLIRFQVSYLGYDTAICNYDNIFIFSILLGTQNKFTNLFAEVPPLLLMRIY